MSVDIEKTTGIINTLRRMSSRELAVTLFLVVSGITAAFWVENRYAKLRDTQDRIELQQAQLLQLQTQVLNVVNALPADVRKEIVERSATQQALNPDPKKFIQPQSIPH